MKKENAVVKQNSHYRHCGLQNWAIYTVCRYYKPEYNLRGFNHRAFTLIELLVVVLIIGILTAVSVPMYKRAVLKSQFSTLMPLAKNLWEGNEIYYLNNGEYATSVDELDVSAPADPKVQATLGNEENHQYARVSKIDVPNRITMYQKHSPNFPQEIHCEALLDNDLATWLCKDGLQGIFVGNKFGYAVYSLSPDTMGTLARTTYDYVGGKTFSDGDVCISTSSYKCMQASGRIPFQNGATCVTEGGWYGCLDGDFSQGSACIGNSWAGCMRSKFYHSYCVGNSSYGNESACDLGTFNDHSVCYANKQRTCTGTYDETSCCAGNYCPTEEDSCTYKGITPPPQPTY